LHNCHTAATHTFPTLVAECLARWQLRRLSQQEGTHCRFCSAELPAWTAAAPPDEGASLAIVSIHVAGRVHQVRVLLRGMAMAQDCETTSPQQPTCERCVGRCADLKAQCRRVTFRAVARDPHACLATKQDNVRVLPLNEQVSLPPGAEGAAAFKQQVEAITGAPFSDEVGLASQVASEQLVRNEQALCTGEHNICCVNLLCS
jgi:hypothetical protein